MREQFRKVRNTLTGALMTGAMILAASPASAMERIPDAFGVGPHIAEQGNDALRQIRKEARKSARRSKAMPVQVSHDNSGVEPDSGDGDSGEIWIPSNQLVCFNN